MIYLFSFRLHVHAWHLLLVMIVRDITHSLIPIILARTLGPYAMSAQHIHQLRNEGNQGREAY